jgi:coenzyme F420-reducing hydrogenase delta subunit
MCSGGLDPVYVSKALLEGADGVLIGGCHPGDCHYQSGNYKARRRVAILHSILEQMGFDSERVWLRWISASEGRASPTRPNDRGPQAEGASRFRQVGGETPNGNRET